MTKYDTTPVLHNHSNKSQHLDKTAALSTTSGCFKMMIKRLCFEIRYDLQDFNDNYKPFAPFSYFRFPKNIYKNELHLESYFLPSVVPFFRWRERIKKKKKPWFETHLCSDMMSSFTHKRQANPFITTF